MENGLSTENKVNILKELREKWNRTSIEKLKIDIYTKHKKYGFDERDRTFIYDIEYGDFSKVASIGDPFSSVRCIYSHGKQAKSPNMKSDDKYSWYAKYGESSDVAFKAIRKELINLIDNCNKNENSNNFDWVYDENSTLGTDPKKPTHYKKALVFLYQKRNVEDTTLIPIFKEAILKKYIEIKQLKPEKKDYKDYYNLQRFLISHYKIKNLYDAIEKSVEIWDLWKYQKIENEENRVIEGQAEERTILHRKRDGGLVKKCKDRDNYICQSCDFYFEKQIVEAHHLEPLATSGEIEINSSDLITLCPTCHRVAHYLLRKNKNLITKEKLIPEIENILKKAYSKD